jgi:hypothetical protein
VITFIAGALLRRAGVRKRGRQSLTENVNPVDYGLSSTEGDILRNVFSRSMRARQAAIDYINAVDPRRAQQRVADADELAGDDSGD